MKFHLTLKSSNTKTGPIPVSTSPQQTCPLTCPLKGKGCYADGGPLLIHWKRVTSEERGVDYKDFCEEIKGLPLGQLWRHNQCGDLVSMANAAAMGPYYGVDVEVPRLDDTFVIDKSSLGRLVNANGGKRGFTYTHYDVLGKNYYAYQNKNTIKQANEGGFVINLSADDLQEADDMVDLDIAPVTVMLPSNGTIETYYTPKGRKVICCPVAAEKLESCAVCKLCAIKGRKSIIGFPAHGARKKTIDQNLIRFSQIEV